MIDSRGYSIANIYIYIQGGVLRCPYWISLMGDKERISIYHRSMCIIYPFKKWSLTLLLTSWLQYQMFKKAPQAVSQMYRKRRKKEILLFSLKPNMCNYFPYSYPSTSHLDASLRYLIYRFSFSLSFFPSFVYVHS
jgi:hypothetical protein